MNIKRFCVTDKVQSKELEIQHCPTNQMVADCLTKALQGAKFARFRKIIMNLE